MVPILRFAVMGAAGVALRIDLNGDIGVLAAGKFLAQAFTDRLQLPHDLVVARAQPDLQRAALVAYIDPHAAGHMGFQANGGSLHALRLVELQDPGTAPGSGRRRHRSLRPASPW